MIYITGDCHGGFQRFSTDNFPQQRRMSHDDYIIVTGDFGGVWDGSKHDQYWLDWLETKPFTTLFVCGNHENFDLLNAFPRKEWHGGKVHEVRPHVLHLMRGQVFEICGLTFFTMGGAASYDVRGGILDPTDPNFKELYWRMRQQHAQFRVKGVSWWPEEMPCDEEYEDAVRNLEQANWQVDCVLTHCAPSGILEKLGKGYTPDRLTDFLDTVNQRCRFDYWFLGHYHRNCVADDHFIILWEQMVELQCE